jgi:DNA polymerase elongation subunit (family B)
MLATQYNKKTKHYLKNSEDFSNVSVAISSAITSYARIYMNNIKLNILKRGGNIYYTDTDSIVTDIKLENKYVGKSLGQFKLEHEILLGYFISSKTYCLLTKDYKTVIKAKSASSESLD